MKKFVLMFLCGTMILSGCGMSNTGKGSLIGSGAGAAIGAGLGYLIGKDGKGAAIGAAIGTAVGGGTGAIIGKKMDQKAEELAALENAQVETVEDVNGLKAIKVTFDSGILFDFNKATLKADAKRNLDKFAAEMADLPDTDITVLGHTDNVGSAEANQKVSDNRANAVSSYLQGKGIAKSRIVAEGHSYNDPVADNSTAEGRAQNRRVEIYISANENMIKAAENGRMSFGASFFWLRRAMTLKQITALALALTLVFSPADARRKPKVEPKIKVSCVGNSITYGMRLDDRERESYPAQLQALLGDRYEVGNFGKSGATLLRHGHRPYFDQEEFRQAMEFAGDIVVIHLGINDTDPRNWPHFQDEFVGDYLALIDSLRSVNPQARFLIARMTPIGSNHTRFISGTKHENLARANPGGHRDGGRSFRGRAHRLLRAVVPLSLAVPGRCPSDGGGRRHPREVRI